VWLKRDEHTKTNPQSNENLHQTNTLLLLLLLFVLLLLVLAASSVLS
jgi:hypothetical protein